MAVESQENRRIFDNCASVNFRNLVQEDEVAKTRTFEVSKTGQWTLVGWHLSLFKRYLRIYYITLY